MTLLHRSPAPSSGGTMRAVGWLPDVQALDLWLKGQKERLASSSREPLHREVQELKDLVDRDPVIRMYFERMVREVPERGQYRVHHVESVDQLLHLINGVLTSAPGYDRTVMVGCPLCAILAWTMGTPAGFAAYRDPRVNAVIKRILNKWAVFLDSAESLCALNDSPTGWCCEDAREMIRIHEYEHDPDDAHWGFHSWNEFFIRRFKPGARPVASPNDSKVIVGPCESTPYALRTGVRRRDDFWIKSQPYSLDDLLANDPCAERFVGGTVYQAYLSALFYHRWHSPIAGTIVKAQLIPGTYFSELDLEGEDPSAGCESQGYMAHVAARALFLIDADDPAIGLVGFVAVGMAEVSSCVIHPTLTAGCHVDKGEELGFFQFGGSTYCLVFRAGAISEFAPQAIPDPKRPDARVPVNSILAIAN